MVPSKLLVVGQIPPPWGGQAVMIAKLVEAKFVCFEHMHIPMQFSADMHQIGRFGWRKLFLLPVMLWRIWRARFKYGCRYLYYPPGGASLAPIYRDACLLLGCRFLFRGTIFHIHAGGFTAIANKAPWPLRWLIHRAYGKVDLAIQLTELSPPDGCMIGARRIIAVPNGLPDDGKRFLSQAAAVRLKSRPVRLLFVGLVCESKGVAVLLQACALLRQAGVVFTLGIMGKFHSDAFEAECQAIVNRHDLQSHVAFLGVKSGDQKWTEFLASDVFCFPSHFESENQSLVILEAMEFGLPCVATDWRGMSTMVRHGETGYVVPVKDPAALADHIEILGRDERLRRSMGSRAREVFLRDYTESTWIARMEDAIGSVVTES